MTAEHRPLNIVVPFCLSAGVCGLEVLWKVDTDAEDMVLDTVFILVFETTTQWHTLIGTMNNSNKTHITDGSLD